MRGVRAYLAGAFLGLAQAWGGVRVVVVVASEVLVSVLVLSVCIHAVSAWMTNQATRTLGAHIVRATVDLERAVQAAPATGDMTEVVQDLTGELAALIEDTLGSMHVPTAADHLMGGVAQMASAWFQQKMMKDMDPQALASMLAAPDPQAPPTEG